MGYPNTLFFLEYPTDKFVNSVEWLDSEAEFRPIKSFGNIIFGELGDNTPIVGDTYVYRSSNSTAKEYAHLNGLNTKEFGDYCVSYLET